MQLVIYFLMILTYTHADYPALKTLLSEKGLGGVSQMMSVQIQSKLKSTAIPEVRGGVDIKIGTVKYVLSNMHVRQCSMPDPSLVFVQGTGVSVKVSRLTVGVTGSWATQFGVIHDHGSFDVAVHNIKIDTLLQLGDDAGHLSITTVSCSADVGSVDIQFHGGASFFFKPFVSSFRRRISGMIRKQICPAIQKAINELERNLQETPVKVPVGQYIYLSIPLTSSPAVTDQSFELDIKGEFYSSSSPSEPPFSANMFDVQYAENSMLSLAASEFFVNSAAYAFLRSGVLQINIRDDMIPKSSPIHLNTSQFGAFIPQLRTLYPNMEMQVLLYASETPLFSFSSGVIDVHVPAAAKFSAVKPDGTLVPLFILDVYCNFSGSALIANKNLTGAFEMKNLTLTLGSSEIGDFKTDSFQQMLVMAVKMFVIPKLNAALKIGFLLPTLQGFSLINSQLLTKNGFVVIFTDVQDSLTGL
ncbi:bactericidal permeability-increasing protein-like [Ctenopharyngodon idella]|uniref:bactericidal permeability-increasing protein-like n=1 Tax=Ctenopharyngodon idella TaxID=7959 RepID=UPI00222E56E4|nr:bactericidal permeability-increasing protein-like [Ctenopharyngodon idella]XP_051763041.1 bactericidal permeability-increasing protein-like [Ctenopharyngodon idella]